MIFMVKNTHHSIPELSIHNYTYLYYLYISLYRCTICFTQWNPKTTQAILESLDVILGEPSGCWLYRIRVQQLPQKKGFQHSIISQGSLFCIGPIRPGRSWEAEGLDFVHYPGIPWLDHRLGLPSEASKVRENAMVP